MRKTIATLVGAAALTITSGALAAGGQFTVPLHKPAGVIVRGSADASARVVLLHGLDGTPQSMINEQPYTILTQELAQRYQVIIAPEPFDNLPVQSDGDNNWFHQGLAGHGVGYRRMWLQRFRNLTAWADQRYGVKRLLVAGISWGGMHAMLAACYDQQVTGFAVSSPVVDPSMLTEFADLSLPALDPSTNGCAHRLNTLPGFIGWGDADTRVGDTPVEAFLRTDQNILSCRYHGLGHTSNWLTETNMALALEGRPEHGCYI